MTFTIYCDDEKRTFIARRFEGTDEEAKAKARRLNELADENCTDYYIRYYVDEQDILYYRIQEVKNQKNDNSESYR